MRTQRELPKVPLSSLDYRPVAESKEDREIMRLIDEIYLIDPCTGTRRLVNVLERGLGNLEVKRPDQAWREDITYVPMSRGDAYLCVVLDWYSGKVLGWRFVQPGGGTWSVV